MKKIKNYVNFNEERIENSKFEEGLNEGRFMAKSSYSQFRNLFVDKINESNGYLTEKKINELHSFYELGLLYESKSHWSDDQGEIFYLDSDQHLILVKNGEAFIIEKKTLKMIKENTISIESVNEEWSWRDFVPDFIETVIDKLSGGAKKLWEFVKKAKAAIGKFIHHNHETISLVLSILSAVLNIGGIFWPGLQIFGGACMVLNGILHVTHGWGECKDGASKLRKVAPISQQKIPEITVAVKTGFPALLSGGVMICLGSNDIIKGFASMADPSAGVRQIAGETAKKAAHEATEEAGISFVNSIEGWIHHAIDHIVEIIPKGAKIFGEVLLPEAGKAIAGSAMSIASMGLNWVLTKLIGKLYQSLLDEVEKFIDGLSEVAKIPRKIVEAIEKFDSEKKGMAQGIVASALNKIAKPVADAIAGFCEKYVTPMLGKIKEWISGLQVGAKIYDTMKETGKTKEFEKINVKVNPDITKTVTLAKDAEEVKLSEEERGIINDELEKVEDEGEKGQKEEEVKPQEAQKESISFNNKRLKRYLDYKNSK